MIYYSAGGYPSQHFSWKDTGGRFVLSFREEELNWIRSLIGDEIVSKSLKTGVISIPSKRRDYIETLLNKLLFENEGQDILSPAFIQAGLLELLLFMIRCQQYENNVYKKLMWIIS